MQNSNMQENGVWDNDIQNNRGISGSTLKLIAMTAMFIDHIGTALFGRFIMAGGYQSVFGGGEAGVLGKWFVDNVTLYNTYITLRQIGRIAFPIFCFLLVEGFFRSHDSKKYALRLGIFALLSEIPFDLAFRSKVVEWDHQNVFFTLLIGLLTMMVFHRIEQRRWAGPVKLLLCAVALGAGAGGAELLATDYASKGVLCIMVLYLFHRSRSWQIVAGCAAFLWEPAALLGFIPIAGYNECRGMKLKYFFYVFYPAHLLLLYLTAVCLGVAEYAAW